MSDIRTTSSQLAAEADKGKEANDWYHCDRWARPFSEVKKLPPELKIPFWFPACLIVVACLGLIAGYFGSVGPLPVRIANAICSGALQTYLAVSILDLWEHLRLEKHVTGRYINWVVVPPIETIVHGAIVSTIILFVYLARPLTFPFGIVDWFLIFAPVIFLALGFIDELIFHRRRALHRENILHTVSHIAAGTMLASIVAARMIDWTAVLPV